MDEVKGGDGVQQAALSAFDCILSAVSCIQQEQQRSGDTDIFQDSCFVDPEMMVKFDATTLKNPVMVPTA